MRPSDLNVRPDKATEDDLATVPVAIEACRAILMERPEVISKAIVGLSSFINNWDRLLGDNQDFRLAWLALWPHAVSETNEIRDDETPLSSRAFSTPVGQMLWALIGMCLRISAGENPMAEGLWPSILSAVEAVEGEAGLEAKYVLIRDIGYFHVASPE